MTTTPSRFLAPADDILEGWVSRTLPLVSDGHDVDPVATLVHREEAPTPGATRAVLYVHGFVDYFFQTHHAKTWEDLGFTFYALDLHDYGRSIRPGRWPNWVLDLATYDEEISAAVTHLRQTHDEVVLVGHSTGGLIVSLYAARNPLLLSGVVLNSPWLDLNEPWIVRRVLSRLVRRFGHLVPRMPIADLGSGYGHSLHVSTGGQWDYRLEWKPLDGFGVHAGWLAAVLQGHHQVSKGLDIPLPVFMATSGARGDNTSPTKEELATTDVVLSPPQMWHLAADLGRDVTVVRVNGGRHDLTLSEEGPRERFARELSAWVRARFPSGA